MLIGIHSMVWVGEWSEKAAREAIIRTAEAGYDLIELSAVEPHKFDADLTARLLAEYGLQCSASLGLSPANDISSEDPDAVARGRALLHDALNLVRDTGGSMLCGVIYGALTKYAHPATERGLENSRTVLAELADKAAESNIRLGLEFCNRYETNVINTTHDTLDFISQIGRDNVMAHLDTYHMNIEEDDTPAAIRRVGDRLAHFHAVENNRGIPGTGQVPWRAVFAALHEIGYTGLIGFEHFPLDLERMAVRTHTWRAIASSEDVVVTGPELLRLAAR